MSSEELPDFDDLSEGDLPTADELRDLDTVVPVFTETIDLGELAPSRVGALKEFADSGQLPEQLRKLLQSLPIPALVVSQTYTVVFLNEAWARVCPKYYEEFGSSLYTFFPRAKDRDIARSQIERVFVHRIPQLVEGILEIQQARMWCRIHMRSIRFGNQRAILGLIEDLTLEKKQLIIDRKHKKALREARDELGKRVEERTVELRTINLKMQREIIERKRAEQELRKAHSQLELRVQERTRDLSKANEQLRREVAERKRAIAKMKEAEQRLQYLAHYDPLTGLPNRTLFRDRLQQAMLRAERENGMVALMLVDLDGFKSVNDTFGHRFGDELLAAVAERLTEGVRKSDTVARFGGDEFTVLLSGVVDEAGAAMVGEKIVKVLSEPFNLDGRSLFITASIGITMYPGDADEAERLLQNADTALYQAKQLGRDNCQFFSEAMNLKVLKKLELELDLRAALDRDEFRLYYQPVVDFKTGGILCTEALLRWAHPRRGLLSPAEFVPVAEETGMILPIGEWLLRTACHQNLVWQQTGLGPVPVAVNISGQQLREQGLVDTMISVLEETNLAPNLLEIEMTESVAQGDAEATLKSLSKLKQLGIRISMDDFGTGYSSLSYLKRFPIEKVKIDRSFVEGVVYDADDATIVDAIIRVAHSLSLKVVAEGVETEEQLEVLQALGCDAWQGYLLTPPLPADQYTKILSNGVVLSQEQPNYYLTPAATQFELTLGQRYLPHDNCTANFFANPPGNPRLRF